MYSPALLVDEQPLVDRALLAAAGFLAGYTGTTRTGYTGDLKNWWTFCETNGLPVLEAKRAHLELYVRSLEEHRYARSTIGRRLSTVASYYKWCLEEEVVDRNPAAHVRRPKVSQESTTLGLDRGELGQFLVQAGLAGGRDHALACLLGLNGLRVSEACNADIENIGLERGHHTLLVDRKGGKRVIIPLAPRTYRALLLVTEGRQAGPILLGNDGERLDRFGAYRAVRRIAKRAGIAHEIHPHSLRHAFITAALDAGVPLRDVQEAASHADPRTTMRYDRNRQSLDRHAAYTVATFIAGATNGQ
jgi:site-specific recombinase XerD